MNDSILSGGFVELAVTTRSVRDESIHFGAVVALERDGSVAFAAGDPYLAIFPRSSTKPIQATAMVASGLSLPPRLLALVCASHDGRPEHLQGAREILASANLTESALANTADYPLDDDAAHAAIASGLAKSSLQMNCSGKHSGMLATCVHNSWAHDASYLHVDHPLQRMRSLSLALRARFAWLRPPQTVHPHESLVTRCEVILRWSVVQLATSRC